MRKIMVVLFILAGAMGIGYTAKAIHIFKVNEEYPISNNERDIKKYVDQWQTRAGEVHPVVMKIQRLGKSNTYVAYFKSRTGESGIAILKEGPNKNLQIRTTHYGKNDEDYYSEYYGVNTNKGRYGIIAGKDPTNKIDSVRAELVNDSFTFTVAVPRKDYFFIVKRLPSGVENYQFASLYLLDEHRNEIRP
ncbi:hypothetical protein [Priestia koreensis]|uniref:hypothetical protein n=1 Tax=Priestia koreensis TaxID=284581 RepID=UPI00345A7A99